MVEQLRDRSGSDLEPDRSRSSSSARSVRLAALAFASAEIVAFATWLSLGRTEWFHGDDWEFVAGRSAFDLDDLFTDHNTHWSTVPILVFRLLWQVFGIGSYMPYLVVVVALHLTVAALLWYVMRRSGVHPWIATAAASLFAFFGAGYQNIVWAFQIGFVGGLALGLVHMLLADHDGEVDRRDWFGLAAGLGAILSAGVGVTTVGVTGLVVLLRRGPRGWRVALFHSAPLGALYVLWWFTIARHTPHPGVQTSGVGVGDVWAFVRHGLQRTFESLGQWSGLALLFGMLLVVGLALTLTREDWPGFRRRAAVPVGMALGAVAFLVFSGYGRVGLLGPEQAGAPRYQHVVAALMLPIVTVALDGLARLRRFLVPVFCILLLLGIPRNIDVLATHTESGEQAHRAYRHFILSIPHTRYASQVPHGVRPDTQHIDHVNITVGWLLAGAASGRIPEPDRISRDDEATVRFHLGLIKRDEDDGVVKARCRTAEEAMTRHLRKGDAIHFEGVGMLRVTPASSDVAAATRMQFSSAEGSQLVAVLDPVDVTLQQQHPFLPVTVCDVVR